MQTESEVGKQPTIWGREPGRKVLRSEISRVSRLAPGFCRLQLHGPGLTRSVSLSGRGVGRPQEAWASGLGASLGLSGAPMTSLHSRRALGRHDGSHTQLLALFQLSLGRSLVSLAPPTFFLTCRSNYFPTDALMIPNHLLLSFMVSVPQSTQAPLRSEPSPRPRPGQVQGMCQGRNHEPLSSLESGVNRRR